MLDPASAALQRQWHEYQSKITNEGRIDSARLIVSYGVLPVLSSPVLCLAIQKNKNKCEIAYLGSNTHKITKKGQRITQSSCVR